MVATDSSSSTRVEVEDQKLRSVVIDPNASYLVGSVSLFVFGGQRTVARGSLVVFVASCTTTRSSM